MESKETKKRTDERKRPVMLGVIILLIIIIGGAGFSYYWINDIIHYVSTDDAAVDGDHVTVSARMLGRIKNMYAAEGDKVESGQLLIQLDDADLRAQESQAAASLNYAKQNLVLAKVNLDKTQDDYDRTKSLFDSGVSTKEQYNHAAKALDTAKAQHSIAQAQIDTANAQLGVIETQLLNTKITAPISGSVAKQSLYPGDIVQPGQAIYSINALNNVWVTANFEETKIRDIRINEPVVINIDAYPYRPLKGHVVRISAGIVPPSFTIGEFTKTTQRIPVKIEFDKIPDNMLILPGMSLEVKIKVK